MKKSKKALLLVSTVLALTLASVPTIAQAKAHTWSQARVKQEVVEAGKFYHLSDAKITYLKGAAVDIIFALPGKPAHESGGNYYATNGSCKGSFQFNSGWHLTKRLSKLAKKEHHHHYKGEWRYCPECSVYRFVKVYVDGGKPALYRHWKSTLGR